MDFDVDAFCDSILIQGYKSLPCGNLAEVWLFLKRNPREVNFTEVFECNHYPDFAFSEVSKCVLKDDFLYAFTSQEGYMDVRQNDGSGYVSRSCRLLNPWCRRTPLLLSLKETTLAVAEGDIIYLLPHKPSSLYRDPFEPENVAYQYNIRTEEQRSLNRPLACPRCGACDGSTEAWHSHFCATVEGGSLLTTVAEGNTLCLHKYDPLHQTWSHCCGFKDIPMPVSDYEHAVYGHILFFSFSADPKTTALYVIDVSTREVLKQYKFRVDSICGKQSRFLVALSHNRVCYLCYDRYSLYITRLKLCSGDFDKAPEFFPSSGSAPKTVVGKLKGKYLTWKCCKYVHVVSQPARIEKELEESVSIEAEGLLSCILCNIYTKEIGPTIPNECEDSIERRKVLIPLAYIEPREERFKDYCRRYYKFNLRMEYPAEVRIHADRFEDDLSEDRFEDAWFPVRLLRSSKRKALIRFENLSTEEVQELFKMAGALYVRPSPSKIDFHHYEEGDEVDGWYKDSWRKGVILAVLPCSKYVVKLRNVSVEQYLHKSQVRIHQDWNDGNWVIASPRVQEILGIADPFATSSDSDSDIEEYLSILFADPVDDSNIP